ncbi:DNA glycosylase AlkZ-like family protein [Micromonospora radicis]|uniref:DNA glycosylase AlkZ-like family protein n=1 Tax=Micromonospora radicis TaxID=1894971 RepID=UPI001F1A15BB|nr:crosslink repair DNA glycosylase YcaQ family protein [Micromonospora radicis]
MPRSQFSTAAAGDILRGTGAGDSVGTGEPERGIALRHQRRWRSAIRGRPTVAVDGVEAVLHPPLLDAPRVPVDDVLVLPGFDEYLLGFKDRTLMLDPAHKQAVIPGGNGVFQATVVVGGRVVGTWKRTLAKTRVTLAVRPLVDLDQSRRARVEQALGRYADFLALPPRFTWAD